MRDSTQHINYNVVALTHPPMYLMHKYWARKPHNVVAEYIYHYSKPGEIVLDPFAGSGVTAIEALHLGRKAVAIDLNPMATFITRCTSIPVKIEELENVFKVIESKLKESINALYETKCHFCSSKAIISYTVWKDKNINGGKVKEMPTEVWYRCEKCGKGRKLLRDKINSSEENRIFHIERDFKKLVEWYPEDKIPDGVTFGQGQRLGNHFSDLFTKRALIAFSWLWDEIENIKDEKIQDLMKFTFSASLGGSSKLVPLEKGSEKEEITLGGWAFPSYWIPPERFEVNVWNSFNERFNKTLRGKIDSNKWWEDEKQWNFITIEEKDGTQKGVLRITESSKREINVNQYFGQKEMREKISSYSYKEAKSFFDLSRENNIFIKTCSALGLVNDTLPQKSIIPPNSVDYVFTDPPYGGAVQYSELTEMWMAWLRGEREDKRFIPESKEEIIINRYQEKEFEDYDRMLQRAFKEVFKVLKSGKYLTVTFHSTDIQIRNSLIRSVLYAGFELDKIIYQSPARISAQALLRPYGSATGDYYIRFIKPLRTKGVTLGEIDRETQERIVVDAVKKILAERGEPTSYVWIMNTIDTELIKRGYSLLRDPKDIKEVLDSHIGKEFIIKEMEEEGKKIKKWWFRDPSIIPYLEKISLSERIEKAVIEVLRRNVIVSFDDVLQEIFIRFPNSYTPETKTVRYFLEQYATKSKGKWMINSRFKELEGRHNVMINNLAILGERQKMEVWVAHRDHDTPKFVLKRLELPISKDKLSRIKEIDVLWIKDEKIKCAFEVENSTTITEAIIRGSNIDYPTKRFIIIPRERDLFFQRKIKEPILEENWKKYNWDIKYYEEIESQAHGKKKEQEQKALF